MQKIELSALRGAALQRLVAIGTLRTADVIFVRHPETEDWVTAFGSWLDCTADVSTHANRRVVYIEVEKSNEAELNEILKIIIEAKGTHEYFGRTTFATQDDSPDARERSRFKKLFLTIKSCYGRFLSLISRAAFQPPVAITVGHFETVDEAWQGIDPNDHQAKTDALYKVQLHILARCPGLFDVRNDLPATLAEAIREAGRSIAAECNSMALQIEQVPQQNCDLVPRAFVINDTLGGRPVGKHFLLNEADKKRWEYEKLHGRETVITDMALSEWPDLERQFEGEYKLDSQEEWARKQLALRPEPPQMDAQ